MVRKSRWWIYILIFLAGQLLGGLLGGVGVSLSSNRFGGISQEWVLSLSLFLANVLAMAFYLWLRPSDVTGKSTLQGLRGRNGRRTKLIFLLALPVMVLVNLVQELCFPDIPDLVGEETFHAIMYNPIGLLTVAVLGPMCEEMLFRGGVQHSLLASHPEQGPAVAIGLTAIIFALVHMNPAQMPAAFILGLLLGFAYWWTESLAAPIFIHIFNNSFACTLSILSPDSDSLVELLGGKEAAVLAIAASLFFLVIAFRAVQKEGFSG